MRNNSVILCYMAAILFISFNTKGQKIENNYPNWKLHYPPGSQMGLFLAVAIPLVLPNKSAFLAFNWEANYVLPSNQTEFSYPPILQKRIDRKLAYDALEMKLKTQGYPGRACLLRIICEASANTLSESNGVLGDILHIILVPSTTINSGLSRDYEEAEKYGKNRRNCNKYSKKCFVSFLDLITWLGHVV